MKCGMGTRYMHGASDGGAFLCFHSLPLNGAIKSNLMNRPCSVPRSNRLWGSFLARVPCLVKDGEGVWSGSKWEPLVRFLCRGSDFAIVVSSTT